MPSREEMIAFLKQKEAQKSTSEPSRKPAQGNPSREEMIAFLKKKNGESEDSSLVGMAKDAGNFALEKVADAGKFIDKYTGAPIRAAIGDAQTTDNPLSPFTAAAKQFGKDPSKAPTGKMLAQKAGVSDSSLSDLVPSLFTNSDKEAEAWLKFKKGGSADVSASGAAGLGLDMVADPTALIPGAAIAKGSKAAGSGLKAVASGAKATASAIGKNRFIEPVLQAPGKAARYATIKGGHALTGVPEKSIAKYIDNTDEVNDIISKHGGDMSLAADELREGLQTAVQSKIGSLNNDIKTALNKAPAGSTASNEAILQAMEHVKSGINPNLYPDQIKEIDDLIIKVKSISEDPAYLEKLGAGADDVTALNAKASNEAKRFLQDMAKGSYLKGGQLFSSSKEASKAAKSGAREARKLEMQLAPDTIEANKELARLHKYQENVNKNLIAPGKTESALLAAGAGQNARNVKNLRDISKATGYDAIGKAETLSSAKAFAEPGYLPVDATGKSAARIGASAIIGSLAGGPIGTAVGMALTSPTTLKAAINSGNISKKLILKIANATGEVTDDVIQKAVNVAQTKAGQNLIKSMVQTKQFGINEVNKVADSNTKKGKERWAEEGGQKVLKNVPGVNHEKIEALKKSPKGRELLIRARYAKPGSKAMDNLVAQINEGAE